MQTDTGQQHMKLSQWGTSHVNNAFDSRENLGWTSNMSDQILGHKPARVTAVL